MNRTWFGNGLRGLIARRIQGELLRQGFYVAPVEKFVDGDFGPKTTSALTGLQSARSIPATGLVDDATWQQLTADPLPSLFERCLGVTAEFEGHGFGKLAGNFDGQGLTWGVIGFTLSNGEIQALLSEAEAKVPGTLSRVLGPLASVWRNVTRRSRRAQIAWADSISVGNDKKTVQNAWRNAFARLGDEPIVKRLQMQRAYDNYFLPAANTARSLSLTSELGVALAFDCHVQNGSSRVRAVAELQAVVGTISEAAMRARLAYLVAQYSIPRWRDDVFGRKNTIAQGNGVFRGRAYDFAMWGLGEFLAA